MNSKEHHYYVYLMASRTRVLYCGMTNDLRRRTIQHNDGTLPGFTTTYRCERLVWYEHYRYVYNAIEREKQIKSWTRAKKILLIEDKKPSWSVLSEAWVQ